MYIVLSASYYTKRQHISLLHNPKSKHDSALISIRNRDVTRAWISTARVRFVDVRNNELCSCTNWDLIETASFRVLHDSWMVRVIAPWSSTTGVVVESTVVAKSAWRLGPGSNPRLVHWCLQPCIIEADHVINEVGSTCKVVIDEVSSHLDELLILSLKSSINSSLQNNAKWRLLTVWQLTFTLNYAPPTP